MQFDKLQVGNYKYYTLPDGEGQVSVEFVLSRKQSQLLKTNPEKYKWLHTKRHFDYIPPGDKKSILNYSRRAPVALKT